VRTVHYASIPRATAESQIITTTDCINILPRRPHYCTASQLENSFNSHCSVFSVYCFTQANEEGASTDSKPAPPRIPSHLTMGYVRTAEEVAAYDLFYQDVTAINHDVGVAFTTDYDFAREVVPPCFEIPKPATGVMYVCTNCEEIGGQRTGEDEEGGVVALDVLYDGKPGNYTLSVFVNRDQSLATGREVWSMPKKLGEVHLMGNGRQSCVTAQRKGAEMRLHTLLKAPVFSSEPEQTKATFYEIKAGMSASGGFYHTPILVEFETTQSTFIHQEGDLTETKLSLKGTDDDPLHTVLVKELTSAWAAGYSRKTRVVREVTLDPSVDYRPYLYGRFYDDWPRTAAKAARAEVKGT